MILKKIFKSFYNPLTNYLETTNFIKLFNYVNKVYNVKNIIPKEKKNIFKPFQLIDFNKIKVVMLFGPPTDDSVGVPLALPYEYGVIGSNELNKFEQAVEKNFYKNLNLNFDYSFESYFKQGVFMINSSLTKTNKENHEKLWFKFISETIKAIELEKTGIIFVIFDKSGKKFIRNINKSFHFVIEDYSLYDNDKKFTGETLQQINKIIEEQNGRKEIIDW